MEAVEGGVRRKLILAIDSGTTGARAMVFDRDQRVLASAYREFLQIFPHLCQYLPGSRIAYEEVGK